MIKRVAPIAMAIGVALALSACGDDSGTKTAPPAASSDAATATTAASGGGLYGGSNAPAATTATTTAPSAAGSASTSAASLKVANNATVSASILVDGAGRTLYMFEKDQGTTSACTGGCAQAWPAFKGPATAGDGVASAKLGAANGQVTYNGHLLYYFAADKAAGDANGIKVTSWYTLDADGNKIDKS
jgi:predicted lipoprotein with Yx(FWY)xxD motif